MSEATIYTKPDCIHCINLKTHLKYLRVDFEEVDVSRDEEALNKVRDLWGYKTVPVLEYDGDTLGNPSYPEVVEFLGK